MSYTTDISVYTLAKSIYRVILRISRYIRFDKSYRPSYTSMVYTAMSAVKLSIYRYIPVKGICQDDSRCAVSQPEIFPATNRNPSARRTPAHAVIVRIRRQSRTLIVTRRRSRFDCVQNCQHNVENTHMPMHIAGWISGMGALSSWPNSSSE